VPVWLCLFWLCLYFKSVDLFVINEVLQTLLVAVDHQGGGFMLVNSFRTFTYYCAVNFRKRDAVFTGGRENCNDSGCNWKQDFGLYSKKMNGVASECEYKDK